MISIGKPLPEKGIMFLPKKKNLARGKSQKPRRNILVEVESRPRLDRKNLGKKPSKKYVKIEELAMNKINFLEMEYNTLREEIKETKARVFKIACYAVIGLPSFYYFVAQQNKEISGLILSLPILICIITLLYMFEIRVAMRCGTYIKRKIEPEIIDNQDDIGWENWLDKRAKKEADKRHADKLLTIFFYLLTCFYYIISTYKAIIIIRTSKKYAQFEIIAWVVYVGIGCWLFYYLVINFNETVSTQENKTDQS